MDAPNLPPPSPDRLQSPIARLLRPLVRLFIRSGMTFPGVADLLRELYVNVAEHDFALPDKEQTDSRVSLLTGIHRKEVRRLRGAGAPISTTPASVSRTSAIIARWLAAPEFTDVEGRPLPLARLSDQGATPSFETLVASVTRDVRPRAVLDEWLDRKIVAIDADGCVVLAEGAFVPQRGADEQLYYLGRNLHDHVAAAVANVLEGPRFFERAVHYDGLSESLAETLEKSSRDIATGALQEANRQAHKACESDPGGDHRWIMGIYVYREENPAAAGQPESMKATTTSKSKPPGKTPS
ncbi:DUF6502 family protein [Methylocella silvestris]|uniref:Uncharacterized protein n=1 Tax=Methylocella silvestris TaxID=199596 RepID=A0A2J7TKA4_METSI|nr:DUF6502 family protein [Methylocella silvestris]PNG27201.1 hypothetical protein CR492_03685 [Methylocella silvestris]